MKELIYLPENHNSRYLHTWQRGRAYFPRTSRSPSSRAWRWKAERVKGTGWKRAGSSGGSSERRYGECLMPRTKLCNYVYVRLKTIGACMCAHTCTLHIFLVPAPWVLNAPIRVHRHRYGRHPEFSIYHANLSRLTYSSSNTVLAQRSQYIPIKCN